MKEWYCVMLGQPQGPYSDDKMKKMAAAGIIIRDTLVWSGSTPEDASRGWLPIRDTELAPIFPTEVRRVRRDGDAHAQAPERASSEPPIEPTPARHKRHTPGKALLLSEASTSLKTPDVVSAPCGRRFCAFILECALPVFLFITFLPGLVFLEKGDARAAYILLAPAAFTLLVYIAANLCLLRRGGQTLARKMLGLRIVNADGSRAPLWKLLTLRCALHLPLAASLGALIFRPAIAWKLAIPALLISAADGLSALREDGRALHDRIAGTTMERIE